MIMTTFIKKVDVVLSNTSRLRMLLLLAIRTQPLVPHNYNRNPKHCGRCNNHHHHQRKLWSNSKGSSNTGIIIRSIGFFSTTTPHFTSITEYSTVTNRSNHNGRKSETSGKQQQQVWSKCTCALQCNHCFILLNNITGQNFFKKSSINARMKKKLKKKLQI